MSTTTPTSRGRRLALATTVALLLGGAVPLAWAGPAAAGVGLSVSPTTTTVAQRGASTALTGLSVAGADPVSVTVSTDVGTLSITTTTGLTLASGYAWTGQQAVTFSGPTAPVNAALASTRLVLPGGAGIGTNATIGLAARPADDVVTFDPVTRHYYTYVSLPGSTWVDDRAAAIKASYAGMAGYLATITSQPENDLVTSKIPGASNVWIGGYDIGLGAAGDRTWVWSDGPDAGKSFSICSPATDEETCDFLGSANLSYRSWHDGEPNNWFGTEWAAVTNWDGTAGQWNDLNGYDGSGISGYVVEFGGSDGDAPQLPATSSVVTVVDVPATPARPTATAPAPDAGSPASTRVTLTFAAPAERGVPVTGYEWSLDGSTWNVPTSPATDGGGTITLVAGGLTQGSSYSFAVRATSAIGPSGASPTSAAVRLPSPTTTASLPMPRLTVGQPASTTATADGYPAPVFSITAGALPAGLSLSTGGQVTGTPTTPGPYSFTVTATNLGGGTAPATLTGYVGTVPTAPSGPFAPVVGEPVTGTLASTADPSPTFAVTGGTLPAWLTLDHATGALSGTPTTPGQAYAFTVTADNGYGSPSTRLTGTVTAHTSALTGSLPTLVLGTPVDVTLSADGYPAPTFTVSDGSLPDGLALDPTTGRITGTPTTGGDYQVEMAARNLDHTSATLALSGHVWTVPGTPSSLPWSTLTAGAPVLAAVSSVGDPAPTFAVSAGVLPTGLSLDATTGALTGTPTEAADWSFDITATNAYGRGIRSYTLTVDPVRPTAPTALRVTGTDHGLAIDATAPAFTGGVAVTGYEVSLDGGGSWRSMTVSGSGASVHGQIDALIAGATYAVSVRAVNVVGAGPASAVVDGRAIAPAAGVLPAPTAAAGVSSATVTWARSAFEGVTGYTVTAFPSGTSCTTAAVEDTSCLLGAIAGQATTYTVVVHSSWGDSLPSPASDPVTASAPDVPATAPSGDATLTTTEGVLTQVTRGQEITVVGTGFAPFSTAEVVIHSAPTVLATVVTDATGGFQVTVQVPADLPLGEHTLVAYGVDPLGVTHVLTMAVSNPVVGSTSATTTGALASTGADPAGALALTGLLLGTGGLLLALRRRVRAS